jgi:hypothetical protein
VHALFDKIVKDWLHVRREQDKQVQELLENGIIGVAPVTNLCLGSATTRSHSSQWSKKKLQLKHKKLTIYASNISL